MLGFMSIIIVGVLVAFVVLGSAAIVVGGRFLHPPAGMVAIIFALTAVSWLALIVAVIGLAMRNIATARL